MLYKWLSLRLVDDTAKSDENFNVIDSNIQIQAPEFQNDVGLWENITNAVQEHWSTRDAVECQHIDCDFLASRRKYKDGTACCKIFYSFHKVLEACEWRTN